MKRLNNKYAAIIILALVVAGISGSSYLTYLTILASINAVAVLGINLISGYTGQLHLGQAAFVGLGSYTSAIVMLKLGLSFWISLPLSIIIASVFGVLLGIPALKLRGGPYLALVTQTFGEMIYIVLLNWVSLTGGPFGLSGIPSPSIGPLEISGLRAYLFLCVIFLVISYFTCRQIINSRFGRIFVSIRESEEAAQAIGINTLKYKIMAFAIAAAFGGISGTLYGPFIGYISPDQFRWIPSLLLISMAIVGGLSNLHGGILGAYILTFLPEMLRVAEQFRLILYSSLLILTLTFLPNGLISLWGLSFKEIKELFRKRLEELSTKTKKRKLKEKTEI